jgi:hypothetical protein
VTGATNSLDQHRLSSQAPSGLIPGTGALTNQTFGPEFASPVQWKSAKTSDSISDINQRNKTGQTPLKSWLRVKSVAADWKLATSAAVDLDS